ncbi:basal body component [Planoprotostelium fungivorum]|uniref:Basal body component n=1 Tax=Planoprotostelium fungivorum TaxID=1890364 RepID=A0A2P6NZN1_9EUKA|nr:basal body component [Planoprotostelium fungivorum]
MEIEVFSRRTLHGLHVKGSDEEEDHNLMCWKPRAIIDHTPRTTQRRDIHLDMADIHVSVTYIQLLRLQHIRADNCLQDITDDTKQMMMARKASESKMMKRSRDDSPTNVLDGLLQQIRRESISSQLAYDELRADFEDAKAQIREHALREVELLDEIRSLKEQRPSTDPETDTNNPSDTTPRKMESLIEIPLDAADRGDTEDDVANENQSLKSVLSDQKRVIQQMEKAVVEARAKTMNLEIEMASLKSQNEIVRATLRDETNTVVLLREECSLLKGMLRSQESSPPLRSQSFEEKERENAALQATLMEMQAKFAALRQQIEGTSSTPKLCKRCTTYALRKDPGRDKTKKALEELVHTLTVQVQDEKTMRQNLEREMARNTDAAKQSSETEVKERMQRARDDHDSMQRELKALRQQADLYQKESEHKTKRMARLSDQICLLTQQLEVQKRLSQKMKEEMSTEGKKDDGQSTKKREVEKERGRGSSPCREPLISNRI